MNEKQKESISRIRKEFEDNCLENEIYGSPKICSFVLMKSPDVSDQSITVFWTKITGLSEEMIPESELVYYNINKEGNVVNLNMLLNFTEMNGYVSKLVPYEE